MAFSKPFKLSLPSQKAEGRKADDTPQSPDAVVSSKRKLELLGVDSERSVKQAVGVPLKDFLQEIGLSTHCVKLQKVCGAD